MPESEHTGHPLQLFWIWSAANIGILGVVYGVVVVSFALSFIQSVLASAITILGGTPRIVMFATGHYHPTIHPTIFA